jgi:hypothetical protein
MYQRIRQSATFAREIIRRSRYGTIICQDVYHFFIEYLSNEYPDTKKITLVMDNYDTHKAGTRTGGVLDVMVKYTGEFSANSPEFSANSPEFSENSPVFFTICKARLHEGVSLILNSLSCPEKTIHIFYTFLLITKSKFSIIF